MRCNTTSIARPRYSYTSHWAEGALTYSGDRINIQFPTSHYNSIKANLLLPLEHCFGWMLSGGPTPLWAQLRTFKHIKISQALHCPDYCLNIICFYILSLPLWLIFPLKLYPSVMIFFSSRGDSGSGEWVSLPFMQRYWIAKWRVNSVSHFLTHSLPFFTISHLMHRTHLHMLNIISHPSSASCLSSIPSLEDM